MPQQALLDILASLKSQPWEGQVSRLMLGGTPPDRENTMGARWNPPDTAAIYTSLLSETAIAEVEYRLKLETRPVKRDLLKTVYTIEVVLQSVIDLRPAIPHLKKIGVDREALFGNDLSVSQEIGRTAVWLDHDGLLVPSARHPGANLVIYPRCLNVDTYRFNVVSSKDLSLG